MPYGHVCICAQVQALARGRLARRTASGLKLAQQAEQQRIKGGTVWAGAAATKSAASAATAKSQPSSDDALKGEGVHNVKLQSYKDLSAHVTTRALLTTDTTCGTVSCTRSFLVGTA